MWLYYLIITPIEYLIEIIFTIMHRFLGHPGWAILMVSLAVSTLTLPLYLKADAIQHQERQKQKEMSDWMKHLRRHFSSDEYYMMVNAYYKEQNYHPLYAVKGSLSLLLQIPFFIAAYHFLSGLSLLQGCSFGIIKDLGCEDGLINIAGNAVNLLPILMTCINLVSVFIYTKDFSLKDKIQPVLLPLIFLVLLYHSPSGLVLYWTMNNIYSLSKNIVMERCKKPVNIIMAILAVLSLSYVIYAVTSGKVSNALQVHDYESLLIYAAGFLILTAPIIHKLLLSKIKPSNTSKQTSLKVIIIEESILFAIFGLMLPLSVLSASPQEFLIADKGMSPWFYVLFTATVSCGYFYIWVNVFYQMSEKKYQFETFLFSVIPVLLTHIFCYKAAIGMISTMIEFDKIPNYSRNVKMLNLLLIAVIFIVFWQLWKRFRKLGEGILVVVLLTVVSISGLYSFRMIRELNAEKNDTAVVETGSLSLDLSRSGKNVIVLFLDRASGPALPFLFEEKPELIDEFRGFTYYPNTVAFGSCTFYGGPPLCGGYEYTPMEMNKRDSELLVDKHNEALKVLPVLFSENGYSVTAADLPHGNYSAVCDMSIFDDQPEINAISLIGSLPAGYDMNEYKEKRERNLFFYGLYKSAPAMLQDEIYDTGGYFAADREYMIGWQGFRDAYTVLENLPNLTTISDDEENTFLMMYNNTPHEPTLLNLPEYNVSGTPDYTGIDIAADKYADGKVLHFDRENIDINVGHYHAYMATMIQLGKWMDYLREQGVYDNTRIIIVSDHGNGQNWFDYTNIIDGLNAEPTSALLMIKDFNENGAFKTDDTFMTQADVPSLAAYDLISNPVNPFTGKAITMDEKENGADVFFEYVPDRDTTAKTWTGDKWYHVHDNIYDEENWERTTPH